MTQLMTKTPVVMSITVHDPSGGGGISAAIETLSSLGCHCTPVITRVAAQDTASEKDSYIPDASLLIEQVRAVLEDITVDLMYIGDVASVANAEAIHTIIADYPDIPVVFNPPYPGHSGDTGLQQAVSHLLLPLARIAVFNQREALALAAGADTVAAGAREIMEYGCDDLLITNTGDHGTRIVNHWFSAHSTQRYEFERLPQRFHGAGCTLASALSAYLAHQLSLSESIQQAQHYTFQALRKARRIGMGKLLPDRLHWCRD